MIVLVGCVALVTFFEFFFICLVVVTPPRSDPTPHHAIATRHPATNGAPPTLTVTPPGPQNRLAPKLTHPPPTTLVLSVFLFRLVRQVQVFVFVCLRCFRCLLLYVEVSFRVVFFVSFTCRFVYFVFAIFDCFTCLYGSGDVLFVFFGSLIFQPQKPPNPHIFCRTYSQHHFSVFFSVFFSVLCSVTRMHLPPPPPPTHAQPGTPMPSPPPNRGVIVGGFGFVLWVLVCFLRFLCCCMVGDVIESCLLERKGGGGGGWG